MLKVIRNFVPQITLKRNFGFCQSYLMMKQALARNLYSIEPITKQINRQILSMAYSPGVGAVCQAIEENRVQIDLLTLRPRSVAIVTDGSFLDASPEGAGPALDWIVAQIKYYSSLEPFPFIVDKDINMEEALKDISISYGTVLYLDSNPLPKIPEDLLLVRHQDILNLTKSQVTEFEKTGNVLAYLVKNKKKGLTSLKDIESGLDFDGNNFKNNRPYTVKLKDNRDIYTHAMDLHKFYTGKIQIELGFRNIQKLKPYFTEANLRKISKEDNPYSKTNRLAAIVTDGTAVLGYGNIGSHAGLPVMEGKSLLFKILGDVEVVPVCIYPRETPAAQIEAIQKLLGNFDAINLEDIKAPQCFDIEEGLNDKKRLPIFHDDQHGTAIVTLAGLINAVKVVSKNMKECKILINGAGAAGITIAKLLLYYGVKDIVLCDSKGAIFEGRQEGMNKSKVNISKLTNKEGKKGKLADVISGMDIFIGVSQEKALRGHWAAKMAKNSIIFALANPIPEILPEDAKRSGAMVYGSGRSDFENQINNSLVFPGIFRAIEHHRIKVITDEMKVRAAEAIADCIEGQPSKTNIIPDSLDRDVALKIEEQLGKIAFQQKQNK